MFSEGQLEQAWRYAREYYQDGNIEKDLELIAALQPQVFAGYMAMRSGLFQEPPGGGLDVKTKELVLIAIECAIKKTNPPPIAHTRRAIRAGATTQEIGEVVGLVLMICGMISYRESGRFVLRAATEEPSTHNLSG